MAHRSKQRDVVGLTLCIAALLACGPKTWSSRTVEVPTRTLSVDEQQLFASKTPGGCGSTLAVRVMPSCEKRCDSLALSRDGEPFATLLGQKTPEVAPIPKAARPRYMQPGKDESRVEVAVPLSNAGSSIRVVGSCGAVLHATDSRLETKDDALQVSAETARECESFQAEVECS